jgi:glycosyltransferase involved in cell wall biosynthesis
LPTFGDTFGYSAIESMANHTPVIATRQAALPELIRHGEDGILLDLPVTPLGEWIHLGAPDRGQARFVAAWHAEIDRLAEQAFTHIAALANDPRQLAAMRRAARARTAVFSATDATPWWDDFYVRAADGVVASS